MGLPAIGEGGGLVRRPGPGGLLGPGLLQSLDEPGVEVVEVGESGSGGRLAGPGGDETSTVTDGSSSSTPRLAIRSSSDGRALRRLLTPKPSIQNSFLLDFCFY